jgi:hypothetical protein
MSRLPVPGSDNDIWGSILNDFLDVSHNVDGSLQAKAITLAGGVTSVNNNAATDGNVTLSAADIGAPTSLAGDSDVAISTPTDSQVLTYDATSDKWTNQALSGGTNLDTTATDIQPLGTQAAGTTGKGADAGHVHPMPTLNQISAPTTAVGLNSQKIINLANGTAISDAAAFGQIPLIGAAGSGASKALSANDPTTTNSRVPSGTASGDLSGTFPSPNVSKINGISLPGSAPSANQVLTALSSVTTTWSTPTTGVILDTTASDIAPLGTQAAGSIGKAADAGHVHAMPRLDQISIPTATVSLNSQKITNLADGTNAQDAAAFGQIPTVASAGSGASNALSADDPTTINNRIPTGTASGDLGGTYPSPSVIKVNGVSVSGAPSSGQVITATSGTAAGWSNLPTEPTNATSSSAGLIQLTGDLGNTAANPEVLSTHLSAALPIAQGGTGSATQTFVSLAGDLGGSVTSPTVDSIQGVNISGTPSSGQTLTATSGTAASWQTGNYVATIASPSGDTSGATDAITINSALSAVNTAGGGQVLLKAGTYYVNASIIIRPQVSIIGAGRGVTIIQLANGSNCDVLQTVNFNSLTRTGSATFGSSGAYMFELRSFTVDGNRTNQTATSFGIRVYGYAWIMRDLEIRNAYTDGIYTEWGVPSSTPDVLFFECRAYNMSLHDNGANGWHHCGPTDCQFSDVIIYDDNASAGACSVGLWADLDNVSNGSGTHNFSSSGLQLINLHVWGSSHTWGLVGDANIHASNCEVEGAQYAGTGNVLSRSGMVWVGGEIFNGTGLTYNEGIGIQLGDNGSTPGLGTAPNFPASVNYTSNINYVSTLLYGFMCDTASRSAINWVNANRSAVDVEVYTAPQPTATINTASNGVDISTFTAGSPGSLTINNTARPYMPTTGRITVATTNGNVDIIYTGRTIAGSTATLTGGVAQGSPASGSTVSTGGTVTLSTTTWGTLPIGGSPDMTTSRIRVMVTGNIASAQQELSSVNYISGKHRIDVGSQSSGFTIRNNGASLDLLNVNSASSRLELVNGQTLRLYKNSYANPTVELNGSSGQINLGSTTGSATDTYITRPAVGQVNVNAALSVTGLSGATALSRYAGATTYGAPVSGTFATGDYVVDQSGKFWICTTAGTPGTWVQVGIIPGRDPAYIAQTASGQLGNYQEVATVTLTAQYTDLTAKLLVNGISGGANTASSAIVTWRVKQQAMMGSAPYVSIYVDNAEQFAFSNFLAVIEQNTLSQTLVSLWVQAPTNFENYYFYELAINPNVNSTNATLTYLANTTTWSAAVNSGTQTTGIAGPSYGLPMNLTGATAASRYVGATTSGAPTSGTFAIGDYVIDQTAKIWICTISGSPGNWTSTSSSLVAPVNLPTGNDTNSGLTIKANSATQSANLQQWEDYQSNVLLRVDSSGVLNSQPSSVGVASYRAAVLGDANARFAIANNGEISWGSGVSTTDTFLLRSGVGALQVQDALGVSGLSGATAASRYVGATASGAPTSGTFSIGDYVIDQTGYLWICASAGTPGTWITTSSSLVAPINLPTGNDSNTGITIKANSATQSANLQQWEDYQSNKLVSITSTVVLLVSPATSGAAAYRAAVQGDAHARLQIDSNATVEFGAGSTATDTFLTRAATGQLNINAALSVSGLTGATSGSRYVGATTSGSPTSGSFAVGDYIIDQTGAIWICTTAGSPGTWINTSASAAPSGYLPPTFHGLAALNMDPAAAANNSQPTANTHYVFKLIAEATQNVSKVFMGVLTAGSGVANSYVALYSQAGSLIAGSASASDQSAVLNASGLSAQLSLGSTISVTAGTTYYVSFYFASGTAPYLVRSSNGTTANFNLPAGAGSATSPRFGIAANNWTSGTPYTPPSTLGNISIEQIAFLIGLG